MHVRWNSAHPVTADELKLRVGPAGDICLHDEDLARFIADRALLSELRAYDDDLVGQAVVQATISNIEGGAYDPVERKSQ